MFRSKLVPMENVTTFRDIEDEITEFVRNGFTPGFQVGLEDFDNIFSTYTGQFITVTGIPSSGKSDLSIKWLLDITKDITGKQRMLRLKMYQPFCMLIN